MKIQHTSKYCKDLEFAATSTSNQWTDISYKVFFLMCCKLQIIPLEDYIGFSVCQYQAFDFLEKSILIIMTASFDVGIHTNSVE